MKGCSAYAIFNIHVCIKVIFVFILNLFHINLKLCVMVQFYFWLYFIFLCLCAKLYDKTKEYEIRIRLNHNLYSDAQHNTSRLLADNLSEAAQRRQDRPGNKISFPVIRNALNAGLLK